MEKENKDKFDKLYEFLENSGVGSKRSNQSEGPLPNKRIN